MIFQRKLVFNFFFGLCSKGEKLEFLLSAAPFAKGLKRSEMRSEGFDDKLIKIDWLIDWSSDVVVEKSLITLINSSFLQILLVFISLLQ